MEKLPTTHAVPEIFEVCAKFVQVGRDTDNSTRAEGASQLNSCRCDGKRRRGGQQRHRRLYIRRRGQHGRDSELSKLPALQMRLEEMEVQARHVVANELEALDDDSDYGALDDLGR